MYRITIYNGGVPTIIHGERHKLANAKNTRELNQIGSLSFDIYPNNPGYDLLRPFATAVEVVDTRYGTVAFEGRVVMPVPAMDEAGMVMRTVTCEHVEAYLLDSMQAYVEERQWETVGEFIAYVLSVHNARMPEEKRVYIGTVDFQTYDTSEGLWCGIQREKTWDTLHSKLTGTFGGEMRVRRSGGKLYLDYAEKLGVTRATPIKLGRNMKSSRREVNPNEVITRLYPLGAKKVEIQVDEYGNETEVETEERITIASVNDGVEYIEDAVAIEEYGIIEGVHEWDDVTQPNILLTKGRAWLGENNKMPVSTTLTALDLSLLGIDPDSFELYDWYPCENPLIGLDDALEIVKQTVDISNPSASTFEMGQTAQTTSKQMASLGGIGKVVESVRSQQKTAITNLQNSVRATKASVNVMEDRVVTKVEETVTHVMNDLDIKDGVSVTAVSRYYLLAEAEPAIPTSNPPEGWSDVESAYVEGSTSLLFFVDIAEFSDDTWSCSDVSLSSSYEAARTAYANAIAAGQSAKDAADAAKKAQEDLGDVEKDINDLQEAQKSFMTVAKFEEYKVNTETSSKDVKTTFESTIKTLRDDLTTEIETRSGLIRMAMEGLGDDDEAGVEIGVSESELTSLFTNKRLTFMRNNVAIVTLSAEKEMLDIKAVEITDTLQQGGFQWRIHGDGNLGLVWVGGES